MTRFPVYIAGPYTKPDPAANVELACLCWSHIFRLGFAPFCPHWSHFQHERYPLPYLDWMELDLLWLKKCEALFRIPGESAGADDEEVAAATEAMPVFTSYRALVSWFAEEDDWVIPSGDLLAECEAEWQAALAARWRCAPVQSEA